MIEQEHIKNRLRLRNAKIGVFVMGKSKGRQRNICLSLRSHKAYSRLSAQINTSAGAHITSLISLLLFFYLHITVYGKRRHNLNL